MQQPEHTNMHSRKQFQIDRIAFFSDAVIAIAITLMVLEIKIPHLGKNTPIAGIIHDNEEAFITHLIALFMCFFTIGNLWIRHHELYEHIVDYNKSLIKRNLYFLLTIVVVPITTGFVFDDDSPMQLKLTLFFLNLALCNLSYYWMLVDIFHRKNNFSSLSDPRKIKQLKTTSFVFFVVFFTAMALALLNVSWFYVPFIIGPFLRLIWRVYAKIKQMVLARRTHSRQPQGASVE